MSRLPLLGLLLAVGLVAAGCGESKQTRAEVDAARADRPSLFSTFPATEGKRSCRIPFLDEPSWPRGHVGLVARGKVYVELLLRQPGVFITPSARLAPARYGFSRQGNVEVWWNRRFANQERVERALRAVGCDGAQAACRARAVSSPALRAVNRCLAAHRLWIRQFPHAYGGPGNDPGNGTVERTEFISYPPRASGRSTKRSPPYFSAARVLQFANRHDGEAWVAYRRARRGRIYRGTGSRRTGATGDIAWVRNSTAWAPTKIVAGCVRAGLLSSISQAV